MKLRCLVKKSKLTRVKVLKKRLGISLGYIMMALFSVNELFLFPGLIFLGWSGLALLVLNNISASFMGTYAGVSIIIFSGTLDASSATFLMISKLTNTFGKG